MTKILFKRSTQISLLCILLGSVVCSAQPSSRLEPVGAPVPIESPNAVDKQTETRFDNYDRDSPSDSIEQVISNELQGAFSERGDESSNLALLIPIFAISFVFGGPIALIIVIAVLHYRSKSRNAQIQAELTLKALEAGRELPSEVSQQYPDNAAEDNLRKGVKNIGLGLGLVAGLSFLVGFNIGALGFVLVGIGGAQLVLWKLDNPKQNNPA